MTYCVIPRELAPKLHELLRRHFADDPTVEVVVEHRAADRRKLTDRRRSDGSEAPAVERRRIRAASGRRVADRRAPVVAVPALGLPRRAHGHAQRLAFVERFEPSTEQLEDVDTARVVMRVQAGDRDAFADIYRRYFDRVYGYLRVALNDAHEAEDVTQQVFIRVLEALPRYERRPGYPFRAWLFVIVRNHAVSRLRALNRIEVASSEDVEHRRADEAESEDVDVGGSLGWITDRELLMFIERLPLAQRQVLLLRYMLDLPYREIAHILSRSQTDVTMLQSRALRFLRARLAAVGREPRRGSERARMIRIPQKAHVLRRRRFTLVA